MQRPKRPGRYHDPREQDNARPGTPTPAERPLFMRMRDRYENRYDPRDMRKVVIKCPRRLRTQGGESPNWISNISLSPPSFAMIMKPETPPLPPRPGTPPPPPLRDCFFPYRNGVPVNVRNEPPNFTRETSVLRGPLPIQGPLSDQEPRPGPSTSNNDNIKSSKNEVMTRLLSVLECPVCFEYVSPPILQCREGHLVCSGCRARLDVCPKCRQPFADIRARALEQVAEVVPYPCCNSGCGAMITLAERQSHESVCSFRQYPCTIEPCNWSGPRSSLPEHMLQNHPNNLITSTTHKLNLIFSPQIIEEKTFLMQCFGEIFHCVMGVDCMQHIFVGFVMLLGPRERAANYEFELKFKSEDPPFTTVSIVRTTLEESATDQVLPQISGAVNAVVVSFSTIREVIKDSALNNPIVPVQVVIRKKQDESEASAEEQEGSPSSPEAEN